MKLIHRIGYYSIGLIIGIIVLFFFLGGKKTSCDYGPNARVLKNIRIKQKSYSDKALFFLNNDKIDSSGFLEIFKNGNVNFSESDVKNDTCSTYMIEGQLQQKPIIVKVENCDSIVEIKEINFKN